MSEGVSKSAQGNRVALELEALRSKQLAKSQRDRLKDLCSPLTTPEEAQAFLAAMRDKSHQREILHKPPTHLSSDGMDAWYLQQRQRERELRQRRKEAEDLLRGYRGTVDTSYVSTNDDNEPSSVGRHSMGTTPTSIQSTVSETLDDPDKVTTQFELEKEGEEKDDSMVSSNANAKVWSPPRLGDEMKLDDAQAVALARKHAGEGNKERVGEEASSSQSSETPVRETIWRDFVTNIPGAKFPPERGRYHLYLSYACPGSHRALIVRALKGLQDVVSVTLVHPVWRLTNPDDPEDKHRGWVFGDPFGEPFGNTIGRGGPFPPAYPENDPDPELNVYSIRELYEHAKDTSGKYTIPLLWDKKQKTIVNNESSDIAYMLNSCFNDFAQNPDLDLYTEDDQEGRAKLNEVSEWLSPLMIHGVYRCGFAKNQMAYDRAISELCEAYDRADDILQNQRYLTGGTLTDADIRLFVTLIRFDEVYAFYFKANARLVMLTPSLLNFCREIYQIPGIAETCHMHQIKAHFFGSHAEWNKYSVIPRGLGFIELLEMPHDRDRFASENEI